MARRGTWAVARLSVSYCDWGGSSRGVREFIRDMLPKFRETELPPGMELATPLLKQRHPTLHVTFHNKHSSHPGGYSVPLRNLPAEDVLAHVRRCRDTLDVRQKKLRPKSRIRSSRPSLQGVWTSQWQRAVNIAEGRDRRGGFSPMAP